MDQVTVGVGCPSVLQANCTDSSSAVTMLGDGLPSRQRGAPVQVT